MTGNRYARGSRSNAANTLAFLVSLSLLAGCGAKSISVGSVPFPAEKPVFLTADGEKVTALPRSSEPIRLVFFDAPWCPQCADVRAALGAAAPTFPPGSVRIYRILFDREMIYAKGGTREVAPFDPSASQDPMDFPSRAVLPAVTTLTALPGPFRDQFEFGRVPVLFLLDESGTVEKRWTGSSPTLRDQLAEAVRRRSESPPPTGK